MNVHSLVIVFLVIELFGVNARKGCDNVRTPLNGLRKRRHLNFPEGTNMVLTMSVLKAIMVHAPSGWNVAVEIDVLYPLLSQEVTNALFRKKLHHRQKREFWEKVQNALESYNLNGRSCIYRSICEARTHLAPPGKSLVHDILRAIFFAPVHEEGFKIEVNETYNELLEPNITTSVVKTFMTHVPSGWFVVVEAELVYMLPDHTMISAHKRRKLHHRQKKEIWETLKDALEQRNMNGRACIIRTICEAKMRLAPKGKSLVHDILRAMFTAPLEEREFVEEMGLTYNELLEPDFCMKANDCPLSILSVILDLNRKR
uniref:SFRICE_009424 n=1 Tax=Spodoptera frugiperda TaxID=7108 RepID=A0A2H1WK33_SPOFR